MRSAINSTRLYQFQSQDFTNPDVYNMHSTLVVACGKEIASHHGKEFILDEGNRKVMKFLMLYFNHSPLALEVYPENNYSLDKNIMLMGEAGVGKTFIMEVFKLYLEKLNSPMRYTTISQTQLLNHHKQNNNIDLFTYNTTSSNSFEGRPFSICLNDLGLETQKFYANDLESIIEEFIYARYEIWEQNCKSTHITTNLNGEDLKKLFNEEHKRLLDRMKMFNIIQVGGKSRR